MYNLNSIFQESKMLDIVSYYKPVSERQQKRPVAPLTVHNSAIALSATNADFLIPGQPQQILGFNSNEINVNPNEIIAQNNTAPSTPNRRTTPSVPPLNLPFSPKQNESTTNIRNGADVPMSLDNSVDVVNKSNSSNDLLNRHQDKNLPKNRKNGSIIVQQEDVSSLNSSSLSSKLSNFDKSLMDKSASELLRAATLADGELDYDTLKVLLRQQRKAYKKRLDEEKIKREALEEFIVKIGTPRKSADEVERNRKSARRRVRPSKSGSVDEDASVVSSSTADTNSLLMHLVGHHLRSKSRRRRWSRRSASTSTIRSDGERPSSPNLHRSATNGFIEQNGKTAENFYESTSLFSMREGFLLPDEFLKNANQERFMQDFHPEPIDSHPHSDDGLILNGHSTLTNEQNGEIVKHHLPPRLPLSGETSAYSSARRRRSQELSLRQASRQSGSTNGSSNGGPPSRSSSFPKVGTSRSFRNKPPITFFVSLHDNVLSKTQEEEKEVKRQAFIDKSLRRKQKIEAANEIRRELAYRSRHLAEQVLIGRLSVKDAGDAFNSLPEPSAFPRSEMTEASKKKYQGLPEVRKRREQMQKEFEFCTNRIRAKMYMQKQQYFAMLKPQPPR